MEEIKAILAEALNGGEPREVTIYFFSADYYGYKDITLSSDSDSRELYERLISFITTDKVVYSYGYVSFAVKSDSFFGGYLYFDFDVDDDLVDELIELIEAK